MEQERYFQLLRRRADEIKSRSGPMEILTGGDSRPPVG